MFNKELFLTHIKNAPVPEELGEPLVEMKKKSDIDTIADIMGTSNEPRPLQEQYGIKAGFGVMSGVSDSQVDPVTGRAKYTDTFNKDTKSSFGDLLKRGVRPQPTKFQIDTEAQAARDRISKPGDKFMSRQQDPTVSKFDKVKERADYFNRTSNMDFGRAGNQRRADLSAKTTTELEKRKRLATTGYDPNRDDYDDPIVQLGAHAVNAGRERRAEKKSYGLRPKSGDYRTAGGGYDYDAMRGDMEQRGEIPASRRRGSTRQTSAAFSKVDPNDRGAMLAKADEIMNKVKQDMARKNAQASGYNPNAPGGTVAG